MDSVQLIDAYNNSNYLQFLLMFQIMLLFRMNTLLVAIKSYAMRKSIDEPSNHFVFFFVIIGFNCVTGRRGILSFY